MRTIVIGSGIAGIAASIRLKVLGFDVLVLEKNDFPGGKLSSFNLGSYRFDRGPSLFTLPHLVEDLFTLSNRNIKEYFTYQKADEICRYYFNNGSKFIAYADLQEFCSELEYRYDVSSLNTLKHLERSRKMFEKLYPVFVEKSLHRWNTWNPKKILDALAYIPWSGFFETLDSFNDRLTNHPVLQNYFNRMATYNGSNPYVAPATLHLISHLEHFNGVYFPHGGMQSITNSLYKLAVDLGVQFKFNEKVEKIVVENARACGVVSNGIDYKADCVISNVDVWYTYRNLLADQEQPEKILKQEKSSSAMVFYWGINKDYEDFSLHNILFADGYKSEFNSIFRDKYLFFDPTVYINITSRLNKTDAPEGGANWFVMMNVMNDEGQNWNELAQRARSYIMRKIKMRFNINVESILDEEAVWTPAGIQELTGSYKGALYGNSSNSLFAAFLRHPNFSKKIKQLYFCGGSVHPGGGIPLCLNSARIATELINYDLIQKR